MNYEEKRLKAWQRAGINIESYGQYVELYNLAGGKCEVCETPLSLGNEPEHATACLDHNHETGEMRGILCSIHNYDLWKYERYHPDEVRGMARYLVNKIAPVDFYSGGRTSMNDQKDIITLTERKTSRNGGKKK